MIVILVVVRKQVPVLQALIADQQAEVQLASVPPIVKVEKQVVVREEVQVDETIVVPIIEITVLREITALPVPGAVVPAVVAPVAVILVAVAVDLPGAMFLVDKQKDALLPEVREAIALKVLPVPLKETAAVQEDNLFLYYLY